MKKQIFSVLLILGLFIPAGAEKIADLPELAKPCALSIHEGKLYVMEIDRIHIYRLNPLQKILTFGRQGEGPGEFNSTPLLQFSHDNMYAFTMGKMLRFHKDGTFIDQAKIPFLYFYMYYPFYPVGDGMVGLPFDLSQGPAKAVHVCTLYNKQFKAVKEFYRGCPPSVPLPPRQDAEPKKIDIHILPDRIGVGTCDDKIFIGDTRKGLNIAVFSAGGEPLFEIKKDFPAYKVSKSFKDQAWKEIKSAPNYESVKNRYNYIIKGSFPAFSTFKVKDQRIYLTTYAEKQGKYEFIVMDLKGNILIQDFVFPYDPLERLLMPVFTQYEIQYDVLADAIYFIKIDENSDQYALYVDKITS